MTQLLRFESELHRAMPADRHRLRRTLRALRADAQAGKSIERRIEQFARELDRSIALREMRRQQAPAVRFDNELPVTARREEIAAAIEQHPVVIVCGETGSGKSTQLPKVCLSLGRGIDGMIGHTQPRRIAARSIAARVAEEIGTPLGKQVGYKIRFTDATSPQTYVKLMTDGILLAETQDDRFLDRYDTIILDEAHERSLNIDFLLGYLKNLLPRRPDLRLIITSATIDVARFSEHFTGPNGPAPVIEVSGRTYPVEVRWRPLVVDEDSGEPDVEQAVLDAVDELARIDRGDMLIFMPTERDIHETAKALRERKLPGDSAEQATEIVPLYARLPANQQERIFQPHKNRRIVIATNVAESSLTVPGIRYVIDPGTARISRYSSRSKTQRLPIEPISQASADQRKGRCGRVGPGVCVRLYGEDDYNERDRYTPPEVLRTNLAWVILQTKALRLGEIESFPFLDPPRPEAIRDGYRTLYELGAIDEHNALTEVGRQLARIPVDPRIGRMILAAQDEGCLHEVLIIASALEVQDPRDRPLEKQEAADASHARFVHPESDFLTYLNLWDHYQELKATVSRNQLRKVCRENFLSFNRVREWLDIHRQLLELVEQAGLRAGPRNDDYAAIHKAILTGLLSNVAMRTDVYQYTVPGGQKFNLWPGSALFLKRPKWVVAAELVETNRRYLRTVAQINSRWIEPAAVHLIKRFYSDPHWEASSQAPVAYEKVTLLGLPIVSGRKMPLGPVDAPAAREILIQSALVEGRLAANLDFLPHNKKTFEQMELLQRKVRRHDLLLGQWARYEFYDRRLPKHVYDGRRLVNWVHREQKENPQALYMTPADLLSEAAAEYDPTQFADEYELGERRMPLVYQFDPGAEDDGVSVVITIDALGQLDPQRLEWLVPGLLPRKVEALIRSLPKPLRRQLVPVPDTVRQIVAELPFGQGDLRKLVARAAGRIAGAPITPADFDPTKMPRELLMNVRVLDADGRPLVQGRDLHEIYHQLGEETAKRFATIDDRPWRREGITTWDFELPEQIEVKQSGLAIQAYPMLVDQGTAAALRLADTLERAEHESRRGVRRLFVLAAWRPLKGAIDWLPGLEKMLLHAAPVRGLDLRREFVELLAERAFVAGQPLPRKREEFEAQLAAGREQIGLAVQEVGDLVGPLWEAYHQARLAMERIAGRWDDVLDDVQRQLAGLIHPGFLADTPWQWLTQFPRYLRAIPQRLERLAFGGAPRDRQLCLEELEPRRQLYDERAEQHRMLDLVDPELILYRWMLEEYRVSLFAQKLGTAVPVSARRLEQQWAKVRE